VERDALDILTGGTYDRSMRVTDRRTDINKFVWAVDVNQKGDRGDASGDASGDKKRSIRFADGDVNGNESGGDEGGGETERGSEPLQSILSKRKSSGISGSEDAENDDKTDDNPATCKTSIDTKNFKSAAAFVPPADMEEESGENIENIEDDEWDKYILGEDEQKKRTVLWEKNFRTYMDERAARKKVRDEYNKQMGGEYGELL
jgi:hypothetical protein